MAENLELNIGTTPRVFSHRNNAGIPKSTLTEFTANGIGIADWGMGLSWDYTEAEENHQDAAKKSMEMLLTINEHGGYGALHTKGYEQVVIGHASSPCLRFVELEDTGGNTRVFKAFEFDEFTSVDLQNDYPELHNRLSNIAGIGTTVKLGEEYETLLTDAFTDLDLSDDLR